MTAVLRERGVTMANYDALCARLNAEGMGVDAGEYSYAQWDETGAVMTLRLYALDTRVRSQETSISVAVSTGTDDAARIGALSQAYDSALEYIGGRLDSFVGSVKAENLRLARLHAAPIAPVTFETGEPCQVRYAATPDMTQAIMRWGGLPAVDGFPALCAALNARGAGLAVAGGASLDEGRSRAWSTLALFDGATGVIGGAEVFSLGGTDQATQENVDADLHASLQGALAGMIGAQDSIVGALEQGVARNRQVFASGS